MQHDSKARRLGCGLQCRVTRHACKQGFSLQSETHILELLQSPLNTWLYLCIHSVYPTGSSAEGLSTVKCPMRPFLGISQRGPWPRRNHSYYRILEDLCPCLVRDDKNCQLCINAGIWPWCIFRRNYTLRTTPNPSWYRIQSSTRSAVRDSLKDRSLPLLDTDGICDAYKFMVTKYYDHVKFTSATQSSSLKGQKCVVKSRQGIWYKTVRAKSPLDKLCNMRACVLTFWLIHFCIGYWSGG